jgi:hypothetical protein
MDSVVFFVIFRHTGPLCLFFCLFVAYLMTMSVAQAIYSYLALQPFVNLGLLDNSLSNYSCLMPSPTKRSLLTF